MNFTALATSPSLPASTAITFSISKIVNPPSTKPSNTFSVYSYLLGYLIESLTSGVTVTMTTPASLTASVVPNSAINGDSTYYLLFVTPSIAIPTGSILKFTIPSEVTLASPTCFVLSGTTTSIGCTYVGNVLSITTTSAMVTSTQYNFQVTGFTNPRTMTQSSSFGLTFYTSDNYIISQGTAAGIKNTAPNYITSLTSQVIVPAQSYLNGSQTILFTITTKNKLASTDYIYLAFPSVYTYEGTVPAGTSICTEPSSNYMCVPEAGNTDNVKITGSFSNQDTFSFHVQYY